MVGCYSFQPIENISADELTKLYDKSLNIFLTNGEEIFSEEYHHTYVAEPEEYIIYFVSLYNKKLNKSETFKGKILLNEVDSISYYEKNNIYKVYLNNEDVILFRDIDHFRVTSETEPGFWWWKDNIIFKSNLNEIKSIEVDKLNVAVTSLVIIGTALVIAAVILSSSFSFDGSLVGGEGSF
jgi:hypothetical protein